MQCDACEFDPSDTCWGIAPALCTNTHMDIDPNGTDAAANDEVMLTQPDSLDSVKPARFVAGQRRPLSYMDARIAVAQTQEARAIAAEALSLLTADTQDLLGTDAAPCTSRDMATDAPSDSAPAPAS